MSVVRLALAVGILAVALPLSEAAAQTSTAFSYQGYLEENDTPVDGTYDFRFSLYDDRDTGSLVAGPVTVNGVMVAGGLYGVRVDFGSALGLWEGERWLQVEAMAAGGEGFATLAPRTAMLAVPRAQALTGMRTAFTADGTWGESANVEGGWPGNAIAAGVVAATIGGGGSDVAGTLYPNVVTDHYGTVGGGQGNRAGDDDGVLHDARYATVGGGANNAADGFAATVAGGVSSTASGQWSTVGGGHSNEALADYATVGGGGSDTPGQGNRVYDHYGTVGGGVNNVAGDASDNDAFGQLFATVAGGKSNEAIGPGAAVGGGNMNTASGTYSTVGGGIGNSAEGQHATVGGGSGNQASGVDGTIGGGKVNVAGAPSSTVAGGLSNAASGDYATVSGGYDNTASAERAAVVGGQGNVASGRYAAIGGGHSNVASDFTAAVGGGHTNVASGQFATVPGGRENQAGGDGSFAGGTFARVRSANEVGWGDTEGDEGTFMWADHSSFQQFVSDGPDQFLVRASGGTTFYSNTSASVGVRLNPGSGSWTSASSRVLKTDFAPLDVQEVLHGVARLDLQAWRYRAEPAEVRHVGPMAEEFHALFGLGSSEETIATVDADGVALAAIQALYERLQRQQVEIDQLRTALEAPCVKR